MISDLSEYDGAAESFVIALRQMAPATVVRLRGEVDLATSSLITAICRELSMKGHRRIVMDMEGITFIDASGLRALFDCQTLVEEDRGAFELIPSPAVSRLFDLLDLVGRFSTHLSVEEAVGNTSGTTSTPASEVGAPHHGRDTR